MVNQIKPKEKLKKKYKYLQFLKQRIQKFVKKHFATDHVLIRIFCKF